MTKWEYKVFAYPVIVKEEKFLARSHPNQLEDILNKFGAEGWELISDSILVLTGISGDFANTSSLVFKRPL